MDNELKDQTIVDLNSAIDTLVDRLDAAETEAKDLRNKLAELKDLKSKVQNSMVDEKDLESISSTAKDYEEGDINRSF